MTQPFRVALRIPVASARLSALALAAAVFLSACGTPLVNSIRNDDGDRFRSLVDRGEGLETRYKGLTPLMWAAYEGNAGMVAYLLDHGAKIDAVDQVGNTALAWALGENKEAAAEVLISKGAGVNRADASGRAALHIATWSGSLRLVKLLVEKGSDLEARDTDGCTALLLSAWLGNFEITSFLLEKGARPNVMDKQGNTLLSMTVAAGDVEMLKYLFARGLDPRATDGDGRTLLISAVRYGQDTVSRYLLAANLNEIDAADVRGNTALFYAVRPSIHANSITEHVEAVSLLLSSGATVDYRNKKGLTPLMVAAIYGSVRTVEVLIDHGADTSLKTRNGETILYFANYSMGHTVRDTFNYLPENDIFIIRHNPGSNNYYKISQILENKSKKTQD